MRSTRRNVSNVIKDVKEGLAWGPGPRAGQALMLATRARALIQGRFSPSIDDVVALAHPVLRHRIVTNFAAESEGITADRAYNNAVSQGKFPLTFIIANINHEGRPCFADSFSPRS